MAPMPREVRYSVQSGLADERLQDCCEAGK
jgi:hypothetical protein